MIGRLVVVLMMASVIVGWFAFDLDQQLSLDGVKSMQARFDDYYAQAPLLVAAVFVLFYGVVTASSLPAAAILTLTGGALFGFVAGTIIVALGATLGATLSFLAARFLLHDFVQRRFGKRLELVNEGIRRDGPLYLLTLRLVPIFPFFVINPLMALTPIRLWTYIWVSIVGMLPGTAVYVNAGTQLANINSLDGILSRELLIALGLLGVFPIIAKWLVNLIKRRRVYAGWRRPRSYDRNLIVIGAGAAGLVTAYIAATVKARVTLVEAEKMGGDCLNYGCVPSKALIASARVANTLKTASDYGIAANQSTVDFKAVINRVHRIIDQIEPHDSVERYTGMGVDVVHGYATIRDPWTVVITTPDGGTRELTTRAIVIAAGAAPLVPHLPGLEEVGYFTSDTLWDGMRARDSAPKRLLVIGGGPIGCELSQAFARLGSAVTLIHNSPGLLVREDEDVAGAVATALNNDGVSLHLNTRAVRCERRGEAKLLIAESEGEELEFEFDDLLLAVGRAARLSGYGLEALGIATDHTVVTNEYLETVYPNIYAAGDVAGPYQFTHVAAHQAWYASVNALFGQFKRFKADYSVIPTVTYTDPEVARVGLSENEAIARGIEYEVTTYDLEDLDRAICDGTDRGFVKIITPPAKDRILGATIVGAHSGELLAEFVLAMRYGIGLNKVLGTIHSYPTMAEANKYAAGEWKRKHVSTTVLNLLSRYHQWRRS